jgi:CheY-like chemotaxis protein
MPEMPLQGKRVLVVDDDPVFLRLMEGILDKLGCVYHAAHDGKEAVAVLKGYSFDICFMDIMMPRMNGIEAAQIIRDEITKVLPIIAITASQMKATHEKCLDVGMNDFVVKPVSMEIVQDKIQTYALKTP